MISLAFNFNIYFDAVIGGVGGCGSIDFVVVGVALLFHDRGVLCGGIFSVFRMVSVEI